MDSIQKAIRLENRWGVVVLLAFGLMIAWTDRSSMSAAIADPEFVREYSLTHIEMGWLGSSVFWVYGILQLPMGWLVDRYGVKWPYAICFFLWCVAAAATGLVNSLGALLVVRVIIGAAEAVVVPATYRYIADRFEETQKGSALAIYAIGGKAGPAMGAPLAAWLIAGTSWKIMFIVTGLAGLVWLIPWFLMVRNDFPDHAELATRKQYAATVPLRNLLVSPVVWGGLITNFCYAYFVFFCMTWMPAYLVEQRGLSLTQAGLYTALSFCGVAIAAGLSGWAADRLIMRGYDAVMVRKSFMVVGFIGGMTTLCGAYASTVSMALFWNVLSLTLVGLVTTNNLALVKLTLIPKQATGLNTGLQQVATSLAGGVSASLSGWFLYIGHSYTMPMIAIFVFLFLGAASTIVLMRRKWAPKINEPAELPSAIGTAVNGSQV